MSTSTATYSGGTNAQGQGIGSIIPSGPVIDSSTGNVQSSSPVTTSPAPYVAPTNTTINSSSIAPATPVTLPSPPPINTGVVANASIPTPAQIIAQDTAPTALDAQQTSILNNIAQLTGNQSSLATDQAQQENAAGVPALANSVNNLTTQLQGLSDQSTQLQTNASAGGTIQNLAENAVTAAGGSNLAVSAMEAPALRNNQIQQASIAAQSLTVKSALYAAQGNYTLAKSAADQAAQVAFDAQTQQINYQKAALAAIQPQLTEEQKTQTATMSADLSAAQNIITQQQDNYKTGQAAIVDAMKNNPTNAAAQQAAQQALQLNPTDPQYLQKVSALVGNYGTDVTQAALTQESTKLDILVKEQTLQQNADSLPSKQQTMVSDAQTQLNGVSTDKNLPQIASSFSSMVNLASNPAILTDPAAQKNFLTQFALTIVPSGSGLRSILNNTANAANFDSNVWGIMKAAQANIDSSGKAELSADAISQLLDSAATNWGADSSTYTQLRNQSVQTLENKGVQNADSYLTDYSTLSPQSGSGSSTILMYGPDGSSAQVPITKVTAILGAGGSFSNPKSTQSTNVQTDVTGNPLKSALGSFFGVAGY